jgi:hypothetical protein
LAKAKIEGRDKMLSFVMAITILGGGMNLNSMPVMYWDNYTEIYCEDLDPTTPPANCEHRTDYSDAIFWYNGEIVDEHDDSIMPEDCLVSEIEAGSCGYGIVGYHNP